MDKGFVYTLEDEKIIEYMKLSTEDKLQWLEEINRFNDMVYRNLGILRLDVTEIQGKWGR